MIFPLGLSVGVLDWSLIRLSYGTRKFHLVLLIQNWILLVSDSKAPPSHSKIPAWYLCNCVYPLISICFFWWLWVCGFELLSFSFARVLLLASICTNWKRWQQVLHLAYIELFRSFALFFDHIQPTKGLTLIQFMVSILFLEVLCSSLNFGRLLCSLSLHDLWSID